MPPRAPVKHAYALLRRQAPPELYVCPLCAWARLRIPRLHGRSAASRTRLASTLTSSTAVNARKVIPEHLKRLHATFEALRKNATNYVDLSRLQLAIQGLESASPPIRIAILGLDGVQSARLVARLLVADPLEAESRWERTISQDLEDEPRALLLRYGAEDDPVRSNPLLNVVHVPSDMLQRNNLEILVATLPSPDENSSPHSSLTDSALVPLIATPSSFTGGVSMVRHPVHRALVVADGLRGCLALGRWGGNFQESREEQLAHVKVALNLPLDFQDTTGQGISNLALLDTRKAVQGLDLFRESSTDYAAEFAGQWSRSGMAGLVNWLKVQRPEEKERLAPDVEALLKNIVDCATANILKERSHDSWPGTTTPESEQQARQLTEAISSWAAASHTELQERLEEAFDSDEWAKLKWFRLFWRVDDVEMIASTIMEQYWLVHAEKRILWLCGRANEAGLLQEDDVVVLTAATESDKYMDSHVQEDASQKLSPSPKEIAILPSASFEKQHTGKPKDSGVEAQREWLKLCTVPKLQRKAQEAVLQTASLTAMTSGFSALVYLSWPATGLYGAGAFAALGLMWALRRLQTRWESARATWEDELREQGRRVLRASEDGLQGLLAGTSQKAARANSSRTRVELAEAAIAEAQQALEQVQDDKVLPST